MTTADTCVADVFISYANLNNISFWKYSHIEQPPYLCQVQIHLTLLSSQVLYLTDLPRWGKGLHDKQLEGLSAELGIEVHTAI